MIIKRYHVNPTLIFVLSFIILIALGTGLLLLPHATTGVSIGFIDAMFMAASDVCITGLAVIDINSELSSFGQNVMLILFQLGGLGVMTFTGFFGYFLTGRSSYKNQIMFSELLNEKK